MIAALSSTFAGRLADRIGSKTVLVSGLTLIAFGFALAGVGNHKFGMFFFLAVTGLGYGFIPTSVYTLMSHRAAKQGARIELRGGGLRDRRSLRFDPSEPCDRQLELA